TGAVLANDPTVSANPLLLAQLSFSGVPSQIFSSVRLAVAIRLPSGLNATPVTAEVWPRRRRISLPLARSQSQGSWARSIWMGLPRQDTSRLPSGLNARQKTHEDSCSGRRRSSFPDHSSDNVR